MKTIQCTTNEEVWKLEKELKAKGYKKTSDCYWYSNFEKDGDIVILEIL